MDDLQEVPWHLDVLLAQPAERLIGDDVLLEPRSRRYVVNLVVLLFNVVLLCVCVLLCLCLLCLCLLGLFNVVLLYSLWC